MTVIEKWQGKNLSILTEFTTFAQIIIQFPS